MNIIWTLIETLSNGYLDISLVSIDIMCVILAIFTIINKNPIVSVLFLISLFLGISLHLVISGLGFIGLSYLLVYVGAVSILFLFILMLINVRISELTHETSNATALIIVIIPLFIYPMYDILFYDYNNIKNNLMLLYQKEIGISYPDSYLGGANKISFVTSKMWDGSLVETSHISSIGSIMYTNYSIWLIITSVILLLAMVGAIVITIKQN